MQKHWSFVTALALVLLGFAVQANAGSPNPPSGIAGQLFLDEITYPPQPPAPLQTTLSVYVKAGDHFRFLENIDTAADGTFFIPLPPGTYVLDPATTSPYWGYFGQWPPITVAPRQVTDEELTIVYDPWGIFP